MIIDFQRHLKEQDKYREIVDFLYEIKNMFPLHKTRDNYFRLEHGGITTIMVPCEKIKGLRMTNVTLRTEPDFATGQRKIIDGFLADNGVFQFLCDGIKMDGVVNVVSRDSNGECAQVENYWDYPPRKVASQIPPQTRDVFSDLYQVIFKDYCHAHRIECTPKAFVGSMCQYMTRLKDIKKLERYKNNISRIELVTPVKSE